MLKNVGPKVVMIYRMLNDVVFFMAILMVFLLAYGVASHSLLYPEEELNLRVGFVVFLFLFLCFVLCFIIMKISNWFS